MNFVFQNHVRELFPDAQIGIIGSWSNPGTVSPLVNWTGCATMLSEHRHLFDAVTVHQYELQSK